MTWVSSGSGAVESKRRTPSTTHISDGFAGGAKIPVMVRRFAARMDSEIVGCEGMSDGVRARIRAAVASARRADSRAVVNAASAAYIGVIRVCMCSPYVKRRAVMRTDAPHSRLVMRSMRSIRERRACYEHGMQCRGRRAPIRRAFRICRKRTAVRNVRCERRRKRRARERYAPRRRGGQGRTPIESGGVRSERSSTSRQASREHRREADSRAWLGCM